MRLTILVLLLASQTGCAVYTVASTASYISTGKTIPDHTLTQVIPYSDCDVANLFNSKYYCEIKDPGKTYNRNAF